MWQKHKVAQMKRGDRVKGPMMEHPKLRAEVLFQYLVGCISRVGLGLFSLLGETVVYRAFR